MTDAKSTNSTSLSEVKYSDKDVRHLLFARKYEDPFFIIDKTYTVECYICRQSYDAKITNISGRDRICDNCRKLLQLSCGICCKLFTAEHSLYTHLCEHLSTFVKSLDAKENTTLIENIQKKLDDTEYLGIEGIFETTDTNIFTEFHRFVITLCCLSNKITGEFVTNFKSLVIRGSHFDCNICRQICQAKKISSPFVHPSKFRVCTYFSEYVCDLCFKNIKRLCGYCCEKYCDTKCGHKHTKY